MVFIVRTSPISAYSLSGRYDVGPMYHPPDRQHISGGTMKAQLLEYGDGRLLGRADDKEDDGFKLDPKWVFGLVRDSRIVLLKMAREGYAIIWHAQKNDKGLYRGSFSCVHNRTTEMLSEILSDKGLDHLVDRDLQDFPAFTSENFDSMLQFSLQRGNRGFFNLKQADIDLARKSLSL